MRPNQMDKMLNKTKVLVTEKTKDLGVEITRAFTNNPHSIQNKIVYGVTILTVIYFVIMDILVYLHIQNMPVRTKDPEPYTGGFSYFRLLSMKAIMEDQYSAHFIWPTTEYFVAATHIDKWPGISATAVSVFGAIIAFPAAKLLCSESLLVRRIAIVIFLFRVWLDGLDGIVFRMQHYNGAERHTQQSARHTSGWAIDFFCDLIASLLFVVGMYQVMKQNTPKYSTNQIIGLFPIAAPCQQNIVVVNSPRAPSPTLERTEREISIRTLRIKLLWVVLTILSASGMWDHFVAQYKAVFEVTLPTSQQQVMQNEILKSGSTCLILYMWRLMNAVSLTSMAFLAAACDKIWEFVSYVQLFGTSILLLLGVATLFHLNSIHGALGLYGN